MVNKVHKVSGKGVSIECKFDKNQKKVWCILPITLPTSKFRLKRNGIEPIAPRKTTITDKDYIEWQISYKNPNGGLIEFGKIFQKAYDNDIISNREIKRVLRRYKNLDTFDKKFMIQRKIEGAEYYKFKVIQEIVPILRLDNLTDDYYIDIVLKHKQKAVGYQAMVFLFIPCKAVISLNKTRLIDRKAFQNEKVKVFFNKDCILGLLKAFLIASETHRKDILDILNSLNIMVV
jgi:hypothetical protein